MNEFKDIDGKGIAGGIIAWLVTMFFMVSDAMCLKSDDCGAGSLLMIAIIGAGLVIPAWIFAWMVTTILKPHDPNDHLF
jgi:hypothetical protein